MIAEQFQAIPTRYAGTQFRSRLEAKWAAFFDLVGWRWEYEPIDLSGYIPDFILSFNTPLLVEVKPEMAKVHADKIEASGWRTHAMLVGSKIDSGEFSWLPTAGEMGQFLEIEGEKPQWVWGESGLFFCNECRRWSVLDQTNSFHCRASDCYSGDQHIDSSQSDRAIAMWREAGNIVQWRAPRQ